MTQNVTHTKAEVCSVEELFTRKDAGALRIPSYQRKYAWTSEQVAALCKDILAAVTEKRSEYHIGTVIIHDNGAWRDIVDGQQRLTTICLLLAKPEEYRIVVESAGGRGSPFGKISKKDADALQEEVRTFGVNLNAVRAFLPECTFVVVTVGDVDEAFQLFDTQNGRGKPLTPDNLLKAYHFHEMTNGIETEVDKTRQYELEGAWENISKGGEVEGSQEQKLSWFDGPLLPHLIGEHLFRLRRWCRGDDAFYTWFGTDQLGEFKGVTLSYGRAVPPCHAAAFLRQFFRGNYGRMGLSLDGMPSRMGNGERDPRFLDSFLSIPQPIVNGEDFFLYVLNCATEYKMLFGNIETGLLKEFREFHCEYCIDEPGEYHNRYARHVFESLCLLMFDRFGRDGLMAHFRLLYRFAYWERSRKARLWYQSAGDMFAPRAVRAMMASETYVELGEELAALQAELDDLCKSDPRPDPDARYLFDKGWNLVNGAYDK